MYVNVLRLCKLLQINGLENPIEVTMTKAKKTVESPVIGKLVVRFIKRTLKLRISLRTLFDR